MRFAADDEGLSAVCKSDKVVSHLQEVISLSRLGTLRGEELKDLAVIDKTLVRCQAFCVVAYFILPARIPLSW